MYFCCCLPLCAVTNELFLPFFGGGGDNSLNKYLTNTSNVLNSYVSYIHILWSKTYHLPS